MSLVRNSVRFIEHGPALHTIVTDKRYLTVYHFTIQDSLEQEVFPVEVKEDGDCLS